LMAVHECADYLPAECATTANKLHVLGRTFRLVALAPAATARKRSRNTRQKIPPRGKVPKRQPYPRQGESCPLMKSSSSHQRRPVRAGKPRPAREAPG